MEQQKPGCLKSCFMLFIFIFLLPVLGLIGFNIILVSGARIYSSLIGEIAKQNDWIKKNRQLADDAVTECKAAEERMIADRFDHLIRDPKHELQPHRNSAIRFRERSDYRFPAPSKTLSFYPRDRAVDNSADYSVVLSWYRQFKFFGENRPLFFDPHYDIRVTCFVSKDPTRVAALASEYIGQ
ncbi:hypothetical protein Q3Y53_11995 [Synechococcus sp. YX-04-1]|uniref:hypothetical protein n=1 Tax=Synechococcus sp. YX-04-1 TaxID=3062778 RepID=UPI0026E399EB|nr:hypothetical protein [Synechococcus sp. YX-04-1]MDO6353263.1 hypothetical protein [Synechococcus sp. YX-04-1]